MNSRRIRFQKDQPGETGQDQPPRRAVALGYDPQHDQAPRVLATGRGLVAEQILAIAQANHVPIRDDPALAAALAMLEVDEQIPPELYALVAEVLAFVYRLRHTPPG